MLLDEYTSLRNMPVIEESAAYAAGYNVILMPIIQGVSQLENSMGSAAKARSFQQNCKYKVAFAQNDDVAAAQIARVLGKHTVKGQAIPIS